MRTDRSVKVKDLVEKFDLEILCRGKNYEEEVLTITDVNRPGLQFAGFFDYFDPHRLQILGKAETMYLQGFSAEERRVAFDRFFAYEIPAMVISRELPVYSECLAMAEKYGRTLLRTPLNSVQFTSMSIEYLNHELAPVITRHGVLMDVYGEGVLIFGDSGIGKSETAIELIKRGHRLVADDAVEIRRIADQLIGEAPELIQNYLEVRGIGIIDVRQLFGMRAVKVESQLDLVVHFEPWDQTKFYDRLGIENHYTELLDVKVPIVTIPVRPGRNLASIVEVATMNNRHRKFGFNAAAALAHQVDLRAGGGKIDD